MAWTLHNADCLGALREIADESVDCVVTSPPYWGMRDYGVEGQIGNELSIDEYVGRLVDVFREVRRVLRPDGTLWLNLGDAFASPTKWGGSSGRKNKGARVGGFGRERRDYGGLPDKNLIGLPWMVAFALRADGWLLRSDIVWHKPDAQPERVEDRPTRAHEFVFLMTKSGRYRYDADAVRELSGANRKSVWSIKCRPATDAHFAAFPDELAARCVLAGCPLGGIVLDPFAGRGTTLAVAVALDRRAVGIELNSEYCRYIERLMRLVEARLPFAEAG